MLESMGLPYHRNRPSGNLLTHNSIGIMKKIGKRVNLMKKHNILKALSRFLLWSHVIGVVGFYLVLWVRSAPPKKERVKKSASKLENSEQPVNCPLVSIIVPARN